jgi:hypothetical protein
MDTMSNPFFDHPVLNSLQQHAGGSLILSNSENSKANRIETMEFRLRKR